MVLPPPSPTPSIPEDLAIENEGIALTPEMSEAARELVDVMGLSHPYIHVVRNNVDNPSYALLMQYLGLFKADRVTESGCCHWCYDNEALDVNKRTKKHANIVQHMFTCDVENHPGQVRCAMCGFFIALDEQFEPVIQNKPYALLDQELTESCNSILSQHFQPCLENLCRRLGITKEEAPPTEDDDEPSGEDGEVFVADGGEDETDGDSIVKVSEEAASLSKSRWPLSSHIYTSGSRRGPLAVHLCPICLFNEDLPWMPTNKTFSGRLFHTYNVLPMQQHLFAHFAFRGTAAKVFPESGLAYAREMSCDQPGCNGSESMNSKLMIEHLHNVHRFPLIQCNRPHQHPEDENLVLPDAFRYQGDAEYDQDQTGCELDAACLIDHRKKNARLTAQGRIDARIRRVHAQFSSGAPPSNLTYTEDVHGVESERPPAEVNGNVDTDVAMEEPFVMNSPLNTESATQDMEELTDQLVARFYATKPAKAPSNLRQLLREEGVDITTFSTADAEMLSFLKGGLGLTLGHLATMRTLAKAILTH
ncbi:hypothetical protein K474DRAFT_327784 [Panus rudis PR-1116 ss-1]|nr:hypothetical protein K474DRAFT_327784 [Panus rudis PR-1116 ss-1]